VIALDLRVIKSIAVELNGDTADFSFGSASTAGELTLAIASTARVNPDNIGLECDGRTVVPTEMLANVAAPKLIAVVQSVFLFKTPFGEIGVRLRRDAALGDARAHFAQSLAKPADQILFTKGGYPPLGSWRSPLLNRQLFYSTGGRTPCTRTGSRGSGTSRNHWRR
jgi:hypothetical protein